MQHDCGVKIQTDCHSRITEDLDTGVGKVLEALHRLGLDENTFVIYMPTMVPAEAKKLSNGGKGGVWEGGIRVPFIVRGPEFKQIRGVHTRVVGYDLFPTFCEWAGIAPQSLPKGIEGEAFTELLFNAGRGEVMRPREELVFHFPHYQWRYSTYSHSAR